MTDKAIQAMHDAWDEAEKEARDKTPIRESRRVEDRLAVYEPSGSGAWVSSTDTVEVRQ